MPDQLAHFLFARRVVEAADACVRRRVHVDSPAFRIGTFGPDPLFNDPSPRRRAEGVQMHRGSGRAALERMRAPVKGGLPWAADYAAGFFCHYALDRLCHPYIKAGAAAGDFRHVALETAYDRELRSRGMDDMPRRIPLTDAVLRAAACMYRHATPGRLKTDIEIFWHIRRFLVLGEGTIIAHLPGKFMPKLDGLVPYRENSAGVMRGIAQMDIMIDSGIAEAAEQLGRYMRAIDQNILLDAWTDADFSGFQTQL